MLTVMHMLSLGAYPDERDLRKQWMTMASDFDRPEQYQTDVDLTLAKVVAQSRSVVMGLKGST